MPRQRLSSIALGFIRSLLVLIRLSLGHTDRVAIPSTGFEALLTFLRINHRIDQPDTSTDNDDRGNQKKDICSTAIAFVIFLVCLVLILHHLDQSVKQSAISA